LIDSRHTAALAAVGVVAAPPDVAAAIASALESVKGCEVVSVAGCDSSPHMLFEQPRLCLLVAYVGDDSTRRQAHELLRLTKSRKPAIPVVLLAESEFDAAAAEFIVAGAADCLLRPINLSRLTFLFDFLTLRQRTCSFERSAAISRRTASSAGGLVFASGAAQHLYMQASRLARVDSTVLLQGETGSG
jgi:DNA-binding NtrC family response regulator